MKRKHLFALLAVLTVAALAYIWRSEQATPAPEPPAAPTATNAEAIFDGDMSGLLAGDVEYFEGAKGYYVRPEGEGSYPGVVMIHENRGLRPETKLAAVALAREGYHVLAVDLFGGVAEDQDGARELTSKFVQQRGVDNMRAASAFLRSEGATRMASLGWCFGGRQSLELAMSGEPLDATIVYYGGGMATSTEMLAPIAWPVLGIFGDQDRVIPVETVRAFEASLDSLGVENEIHLYPGVGHAFANPSGANYAPDETADAWAKTVDFLRKHLK